MNDDICMTCGCVNGGHFNCYTALESALAAMTAERDGLKVELTKLQLEACRWYDGWAEAQKDRDAWKSRADRMEKALKNIQAHYEEAFPSLKSGVDASTAHTIAKEALDDGKGA